MKRNKIEVGPSWHCGFWLLCCCVVLMSVDGAAKIIIGETAEIGRYAYMVGLFTENGSVPFCGGILIAPTLVLIAQHCGEPSYALIGCHNVSALAVSDATEDLAGHPKEQCEKTGIKMIYSHPEYGLRPYQELIGDYSVLVLETASMNTPVPYLSTHDLDSSLGIGQALTILGYGDTKPTRPPFSDMHEHRPETLVTSEVSYVPSDACNSQFLEDIVHSSQICVQNPGMGTCRGDTGGPLLLSCTSLSSEAYVASNEETYREHNATMTTDILVGLSPWGYSCASPHLTTKFARVSYALPFIASVFSQEGYEHSLNLVSSLEEICVPSSPPEQNATGFPTVAPTSFPTIPVSWTCDPWKYAASNGCDCDCGAIDPDCELFADDPTLVTYNCEPSQTCVEGSCSGMESPSLPVSPTGVPSQWICNPEFYDAGDGCDCRCGAPDPDCEKHPLQTVYGCFLDQLCVEDDCVYLNTPSSHLTVPTESPVKVIQENNELASSDVSNIWVSTGVVVAPFVIALLCVFIFSKHKSRSGQGNPRTFSINQLPATKSPVEVEVEIEHVSSV